MSDRLPKPRGSPWLIFSFVVLAACRAHQPVVIEPVPSAAKTEAAIESTVGIRPSAAPLPTPKAAARAKEAVVAKPECRAGKWRTTVNNDFETPARWPFEVRWGLMKAGEAELAVEGIETVRQRPAYHLSMEIRATGMTGSMHPYRDRTDSWLDKNALTTVLISQSIREKRYQSDQQTLLDPICQRFKKRTYRLDKQTAKVEEGQLGPHALDVYGALFYLRTQALAVGAFYDLSLFAGDRAVPVRAHVRKRERVKVPAGTYDCFLIEMLTDDRAGVKKIHGLRWWVSADNRHLPVRIRMRAAIGSITADLQKERKG